MVKSCFKFLTVILLFSSCALRWVKERIPPPASRPDGKVLFLLDAPSAKSVFAAGEFNGWEYQPSGQRSIALKKNKNDVWEAAAVIPSGRYTYKYVLDSYTWILDPHNPLTVDDGTGNINSLLIVK
ncbi:MAG: isoamylase early set domain-containing protein [Elusimicrobiota bacterium]|nr:isoamylase early set domain-containing protein [Elusimicrobiota bacterium]